MRRKIEAWTGPINEDDSTMIGSLVQAADGSIEQIDDQPDRWAEGPSFLPAALISRWISLMRCISMAIRTPPSTSRGETAAHER